MDIKILFYLPAIFFIASGLPQMIKLLRTKSSQDISSWTYFLTCLAITIIIIDAFKNKNYSILVSNSASLAITLINTFLIIIYRKKKI